MSIKLMSAIFETEFRDLEMPEPDSNGKPRKAKASSMKLVLLALADCANDMGESTYPGLTLLEIKTGLSRQGLIDVISALKFNGLLFVSDIPSKLKTNDYTLFLECYPKLMGSQEKHPRLVVKPLDQSSHLTNTSQVALPEVVKSLDLKHNINIKESSSKKTDEKQAEYKVTKLDNLFQQINPVNNAIDAILQTRPPKNTAYNRGEQERPNKLTAYLEMANFQGVKQEARIDAILSYLGSSLTLNTSTKEWREFAKYILSKQKENGWTVDVFIKWLLAKPDYKPDYWSVKRMTEFYPQAFSEGEVKIQRPNLEIGT